MAGQLEVLSSTERFSVLKGVRGGTRVLETIEEVTFDIAEARSRLDRLRLLHHSNVLPVIAAKSEESQDKLFLRVTYVLYEHTLASLVGTEQLSSTELDKYAGQLLDLLVYLENKDLHHRKISPESLFLGERGELKLGCFRSDFTVKVESFAGEAQAVGVVLAYLAAGSVPLELLIGSPALGVYLESLKISPRLRWLLPFLLDPSKFQLSFHALKRQFDSCTCSPDCLQPADQNELEKCEICRDSADTVLDCSHRYCRKHQPRVGELCSICSVAMETEINTEPIPLQEQMRLFKRNLSIPEMSKEEIRSIPQTISGKRLPLSTMSTAFPGISSIIQGLKAIYTSWRASSIDGNSFYRCLGAAWLERILRTNMPQRRRNKWVERLAQRKAHYCATQETAEYFYAVTKELYTLVQTWDDSAMNRLTALELDVGFDEALWILVRTVTASYGLRQAVPIEELKAIMTAGVEPASEKVIKLAGEAFKLTLKVYKSGDKVDLESPVSVALVRIGPRYALLYSVTQDYFDGYHYDTSDCRPPASSKLPDCCCAFS